MDPSNILSNKSFSSADGTLSIKKTAIDVAMNDGSYTLASDDGWERNTKTTPRNVYSRIVDNSPFRTVVLILIVVNSIIMGVATTDLVTENPSVESMFEIIDIVFLVVFTAELLLNFASYGLELFNSGWLVFDFIVITLSWPFPTLQIVRAFRIVFLLCRIDYVKKILQALQSVVPIMGSIVVLLSVIFYVAAVFFTDFFGDMYKEGTLSVDYFGTMGRTLFTLFQIMTGAGWPDVAREIMITYNWSWLPFVLFISVTMFIVVELTIAALCRSVVEMEKIGVFSDNMEEVETKIHINKVENKNVASLEQKLDLLLMKTRRVSGATSTVPLSNEQKICQPKRKSQLEKFAISFCDSTDESIIQEEKATIKAAYNCFPESFQSRFAMIATNESFEKIILIMITVNSIMMGLATYDFVKDDAILVEVFNKLDSSFLIIFTFELFVQFGYRGSSFFNCKFLIFDLIIIVLSWITPVYKVARSFRCFRLFSRFHFMRHIIGALVKISQKLVFVGGLLFLMLYVMSVICTDLFKDMYSNGLTSDDYFGSLGKTAFTLFQFMTIAGWPDIAREVMETYSTAWIPFITWILLSKFTMLQLVIAIMCQSLVYLDTGKDEKLGSASKREETTVGNNSVDNILRLEKKLNEVMSNIDHLMSSNVN